VQPKQPSAFRRFLGTPIGRWLIIVITVLVVFVSYVYVEALLAIPIFLLFGLAFPIWAGQKRPRYLALLGLVVVLVVAPISTAVITQDVRTPVPLASSMTGLPGFTGSEATLQNAGVTPYTGTTSTNFTWQVTVYPEQVPTGNTTPVNVSLYVSTCPGATSTSPPPWCSAGYSFTQLTQPVNNTTANGGASQCQFSTPPGAFVCTFHDKIGSNGIWDWQMGVYTKNSTTGALFYQTLVGDPTYNGIEGPVVGTYLTTYGELLGTIYFDDVLFLGGPFFFILLIYVLFKQRERRRNEARQRAAGSVPPGGGATEPSPALPPPSTSPAAGAAAPSSMATERTCPNCNAVVYANETKCWKCGASLSNASPGAPLPSSPKGS
jgi:hypothetical protein